MNINRLRLVLAAGSLLTALVAFLPLAPGCTPGERATAGTVLSAVGNAAPVACAAVAGLTGSVCPNNLGNDVSDVARLVEDILASMPPAMRAMAAAPKVFVWGGALVTLPGPVADYVLARLQARDGGA